MNNDGAVISRRRIDVQVGSLVQHKGQIFKIIELIDFDTVVGSEINTDKRKVLRIIELQLAEDGDAGLDQSELTKEDWDTAISRHEIIKPLLEMKNFGRKDVDAIAESSGIHHSTIYRWLNTYYNTGSLVGLVPRSRGWSAGKSRISQEVEDIIQDVIESFYLTSQRQSDKKTIAEVQIRCSAEGYAVPSSATIRRRLHKISEKKKLRGRGFKKLADRKFTPTPGKFPGADYPLAVVQIDHTKVDIFIVDDVHRKPIGRPWVTVAVDVFSRAVTGYYFSMDPPSGLAVGMCVAHSILPKEDWLQLHKVNAKWPVWGYPVTLHADNGADFRSGSIRQSCLAHDINLEFRPVKIPRYGGHVERLLGTFMADIHGLPGSTFSSLEDLAEYDSEKHSTMTFAEFETWFVGKICTYHITEHTSLGIPPLKKWDMGIFGHDGTPGIGLPSLPSDRHSLVLDFLPAIERKIHPYGVELDGLTYYAEALRPWIGAIDKETKKKRDFVFRRDPRDIKTLWFYDPDLKQYFQIPFADQSLPSMSLWEHNKVKAELRKLGRDSSNPHEVLRLLTEMRALVDASQEKTKKARREAQRRRQHEKKVNPAAPLPKKPPVQQAPDPFSGFVDDDDINPFGGVS